MEENGIRAKVKIERTQSEPAQENKIAKLVCHICSEKGKMKCCVSCGKGSCLNHSMVLGVQNLSRICDICFRESSISKMTTQCATRENLAHEISLIADKRDENTQTLNKVSARIRYIQKEYQEK